MVAWDCRGSCDASTLVLSLDRIQNRAKYFLFKISLSWSVKSFFDVEHGGWLPSCYLSLPYVDILQPKHLHVILEVKCHSHEQDRNVLPVSFWEWLILLLLYHWTLRGDSWGLDNVRFFSKTFKLLIKVRLTKMVFIKKNTLPNNLNAFLEVSHSFIRIGTDGLWIKVKWKIWFLEGFPINLVVSGGSSQAMISNLQACVGNSFDFRASSPSVCIFLIVSNPHRKLPPSHYLPIPSCLSNFGGCSFFTWGVDIKECSVIPISSLSMMLLAVCWLVGQTQSLTELQTASKHLVLLCLSPGGCWERTAHFLYIYFMARWGHASYLLCHFDCEATPRVSGWLYMSLFLFPVYHEFNVW